MRNGFTLQRILRNNNYGNEGPIFFETIFTINTTFTVDFHFFRGFFKVKVVKIAKIVSTFTQPLRGRSKIAKPVKKVKKSSPSTHFKPARYLFFFEILKVKV